VIASPNTPARRTGPFDVHFCDCAGYTTLLSLLDEKNLAMCVEIEAAFPPFSDTVFIPLMTIYTAEHTRLDCAFSSEINDGLLRIQN